MFDETEADASGFTDFFAEARDRLVSILPQADQASSVQSQLMDAIYSYGAGKISAARDKAVGAFLRTSEGRKVQASATQQTLSQYLPLIVIAAVALIAFGFLARR